MKQPIVEHYRGNEEFVKRCVDLCDQAERGHKTIITPFLTPAQLQIAQRVIGKQFEVHSDGGYEGAESVRLSISPYGCEVDMEISCLRSQYRLQDKVLTHRDVLGAMMQLGLKRDQFGDIVIKEQTLYLFVKADLAAYVIAELRKIAKYTVQFQVCQEVIEHQEELNWKVYSVSSLRLDTIVSSCAHTSRNQATRMIKGKLVKVNHLPLEECSALCNNNSTISIRGYGRFLIRISDRMSKKGNIMIEIGTYR